VLQLVAVGCSVLQCVEGVRVACKWYYPDSSVLLQCIAVCCLVVQCEAAFLEDVQHKCKHCLCVRVCENVQTKRVCTCAFVCACLCEWLGVWVHVFVSGSRSGSSVLRSFSVCVRW